MLIKTGTYYSVLVLDGNKGDFYFCTDSFHFCLAGQNISAGQKTIKLGFKSKFNRKKNVRISDEGFSYTHR